MYTAPTAIEFKARFPAFAAVSDAVIDAVLPEALRAVSQSWVSQIDYTLGVMLYLAHTLTLDGHGTGLEAELAAGGALGATSVRTGDMTVLRSAPAGGFATLSATIYGQRFIEVAARNQSGPITADRPTLPPVDRSFGDYYRRGR